MGPLCAATLEVMASLGLFHSRELCLNEETCRNFFSAVEDQYLSCKEVPYHNALHARDVVQTIFAILSQDKLILPDIAVFALVTAACIHDMAHPGVNNAHHVRTGSLLATRYNDISVLENFHLSKAFALMRSEAWFNILAGLQASGRTQMCDLFRSLVIEMVLATDMKQHFAQQAKFRMFLITKALKQLPSTCETYENLGPEFESQMLAIKRTIGVHSISDLSIVCCALLHLADISNVAKSWNSYKIWIDMLFEEFFAQGDMEKKLGLHVQPMMDRNQCDPATAQLAFIASFAMPWYEMLREVIPLTSESGLVEMRKNVQHLELLANKVDRVDEG